MANVKITELTAATALAGTDVLPIVDVGADATKKVSVSDLLRNLPDGTASAPALAFADDQNTGVLSPGDNSLAFATSGTQRLVIDSSGRVGIGTTSPSSKLHVYEGSASPARIYLENTEGRYEIKADANLALHYSNQHIFNNAAGTTEYLRINSSGRVGIGTTSPINALHINGAANNVASRIRISSTEGSGLTLRAESATESMINVDSSENLLFGVGGGEVARIDSSGRVGIGTTSPGDNLTVYGTNPAASIFADSTSGRSDIFFRDSGGAQGRIRYTHTDDSLAFFTVGSERLRIDSSGNVGIGTTSPSHKLDIDSTSDADLFRIRSTAIANDTNLRFGISGSVGEVHASGGSSGTLAFKTYGSERMRIDTTGRVGIGTTSPSGKLDIVTGTTGNVLIDAEGGSNFHSKIVNDAGDLIVGSRNTSADTILTSQRSTLFKTGSSETERMRITSSGRVGIGETSPDAPLHIRDSRDEGNGSTYPIIQLSRRNGGSNDAILQAVHDGSDGISALRLDLGGSERMRIGSNGYLYFANQTNANPAAAATQGLTIRPEPLISIAANGNSCANFGRNTNDGTIINFYQAGALEGSISVSGSTVSYNGGHLARWSQLPSGAERTEILRGSVLSNLDEMCEWGEENNEQLNRMKISDVEGDVNVAGVFQAWDDDDDTYTNDFYCAMTGDFVIRIAQGTTVARGDLLMSAGDGTAKPQDDDIVRSKTIAKVTSTTVSTTYADGSYCVPCVLMAC